MIWPWVSRLAYDAVVSERDILRAQNVSLTDSLTRIRRAETGLREVPAPPKRLELQKPVTVPAHIERLYRGRLQSRAMEDMYEAQARDMHAAGAPWNEVERALIKALGEPQYLDGHA